MSPRPSTSRRSPRRLLVGVSSLALVAGLAAGAPVAAAAPAAPATAGPDLPAPPDLSWAACGDAESAPTTECATATLPMDYDDPDGETVGIALSKVPATNPDERIGSLFFNFGGPGGSAVDYLQGAGAGIFATLNERFDIVAFDPRGVGQSTPGIDCGVDQETQGIYGLPTVTPQNLDVPALQARAQGYVDACLAANGDILEHVSTANVARDLNVLHRAVGDPQLNFLGFSYGTFVGATYASMFPTDYRALVLDGPVDAESYINDPLANIASQTAGFETSLYRFLEACGRNPISCGGFALGQKPITAYDDLVRSANENPIPADGWTEDPRPVTGDEINAATLSALYNKANWGYLASMLAAAAHGDASAIRGQVDSSFEGGGTDLYFTIGASEQEYPQGLDPYLDKGAESWSSFPHFYSNSGYAELSYGLWPAKDEDSFDGPFTVPSSSPTPLVVATTYDPATPYQGGLELVHDLGNAALLTMDGDGHTAYAGNSVCIDTAVDAYLVDGVVPAPGTRCAQDVPFLPSAPLVDPAALGAQALAGLGIPVP